MKPTTLTNEEIDKLSYNEARKAVKAVATGAWITIANSAILKAYLKGEIDADEAKARALGVPAAAPASPGSETALLSAALAAAVQPQLDAMSARMETSLGNIGKTLDELASEVEGKASSAPVEIPPSLVADVEALKEAHRTISDALSSRNSKLDELKDMVKAALEKGAASIAPIVAPVLGVKVEAAHADPVLEYFQRFCQPGASVKPVLVKGGQGSGKTYGAREWGKKFDFYFEYGFSPETTTSDVFGFPTATTEWVDGKVARAWRLAAAGRTVFLLLDEIYRAQQAVRQALLTPLSKRKIDDRYYYALNTGRPIVDPVTGVESTEEILAPVENLAIVGTTNVGARFDVQPDCDAGKERWAPIHVEVEEAKLRAVLNAAATAKGFSPALVDKLVAFWNICGVLATDNFIQVRPTTRILSEAVLYAFDEADVPKSLRMLGMNIWVAETLEGLPEPEQVKKVNEAIDKAFAASK